MVASQKPLTLSLSEQKMGYLKATLSHCYTPS